MLVRGGLEALGANAARAAAIHRDAELPCGEPPTLSQHPRDILSLSSLARTVLSATNHPREPCASASLVVSVRWVDGAFLCLGFFLFAVHATDVTLDRLFPCTVCSSIVWGG